MTYSEKLLALADELRRIADAPAAEAVMRLGPIVDTTTGEGAIAVLRDARHDAAAAAVAEAGSQAQLARRLGVSGTLVSRLARRARRHPTSGGSDDSRA